MAGLMDLFAPPAAVGGAPGVLGAAPTGSPLAASAGKALPKDVTDFYAGIDADPKAAFREQFAPTAFTGSDGLIYHRMTRAGNGSENDSSASQLEGYYAHRPGETNVGDLYNRYDAGGGFLGTMKTEKGMGALQSLGMGIAAALSMGAGGAVMGALGGAAEAGAGAGVAGAAAPAVTESAAGPTFGFVDQTIPWGTGQGFPTVFGSVDHLAFPTPGMGGTQVFGVVDQTIPWGHTPGITDSEVFNAAKDSQKANADIASRGGDPLQGYQTGTPTGGSSMLDTITDSSVGKVLSNPLVQLAASSIVSHLAGGGGSHGTSPAATLTAATPPPSSMPDPLSNIRAQQQSIIDQLSRHGRASTILTIPR